MTTHRKLAAIFSADAAGYLRLMADDEAATLRSLNDARALFRERIESHGGRLIDTAGDSVLAEFPSAVEAVDCANEIQHELAKRNAQLAEHRRMQFRIGINLGDVIEQEDGTIYGDGVNVAARLQTLAEPGGICISGTAFDQVEGKLPLQLKFSGGPAGHNGLKDIHAQLGTADYWRLRLGIGHPGVKAEVVDYVLRKPAPEQREAIEKSIELTLTALDLLLAGEMERATMKITAKPPRPKPPRPDPAAGALAEGALQTQKEPAP